MALYPRIPLSSLLLYEDSGILDELYYPEDDREQLLSYFQLEYGEFTPIYQRPDLLRAHLRAISAALKPTIDKWIAALKIKYEPLWNYDRTEQSTDIRTPDLQHTAAGEHSETEDESETVDTTRGETITHGKSLTTSGGYSDTTGQHGKDYLVAADNSNEYLPSRREEEDASTVTRTYSGQTEAEGGTTGTSGSEGTERNRSRNASGTDGRTETDTGTETTTHEMRAFGNIGLTSSQQMLQLELDIARFSLIHEVCRAYAEKLLILIY